MASNEIIARQIEAIKTALEQFKEGASIEEIKNALNFEIELRTLQRRLDRLIQNGIIARSGLSRATIYMLVKQEAQKDRATGDLIPLSNEGKQIREVVTLPIQRRRPVGYSREFLGSYRPNIDSYLQPEEINRLAVFGNTGRPDQPAGTYAKEILNRLLIDLSWNSSRLEGNTYSLLDTQRLFATGQSADSKTALETQMILNHKGAIEFIVQAVDEIGINRYTILNLHALLSENLLPDPAASGRLRTHGVGIGDSVYTPLAVPQQIEETFDLVLYKASEIENPFEQAFFLMVHLPYLQPFDDVNKRVSRLAANIPLNKHNLTPLSFVDVPRDIYINGLIGIYELNRIDLLKDVFIWAYERSAARYAALRQSLGEPDQFRLKYREKIKELVTQVVSNAMTSQQASEIISVTGNQLPGPDGAKFIEAVETELLSLHEGNIARYWIRPGEFQKWKAGWNS